VTHDELMRRAIALSHEGMENGHGGPFGAVVVRGGEIVAEGYNAVTSSCDPTAHAEIVAIRRACAALGRFELRGLEIYTSCEPCPMCLAAIYWARLDRIFYANSRADAARIGFDDETFYRQLELPPDSRAVAMTRLLPTEAGPAFDAWQRNPTRTRY
jgi:tRNA(Arg) A34 adenosine deaminase TadA